MKIRQVRTDAVAKIIRELHDHVRKSEPSALTAQLFHPKYGKIDILPTDWAKLQTLAKELYAKFDAKLMAPRTVHNWLYIAVLTSMLPTDDDFDSKLQSAIIELEGRLKSPPVQHEVFYPIDGVEPSTLPFLFGDDVEFVLLSSDIKAEFSALADSASNPKLRDYLHTQVERIWEYAGENRTFAKVTILAHDDESARDLAEERLNTAIDSLNFLGNFIPFNHGRISLPGDAATAQIVSPLVRRDSLPGFGVYYKTISPYGSYNLSKLFSKETKPLFERLTQLLSSPRPKLAEALLSSIRWAGKATGEKRPEQAFLLNAIALEALLLSDGTTAELNYRLRLRLAHLLGKTTDDRRAIYDAVGKLYDVRSKIVHSGKLEVQPSEVDAIREYALSAVAAVLLEPTFATFKTPIDLRAWFDERILSQQSSTELPQITPSEEEPWSTPYQLGSDA